ncbi:MAG: hypothetical protein ACM3ZE_01310 [Myxococcales bacterium]
MTPSFAAVARMVGGGKKSASLPAAQSTQEPEPDQQQRLQQRLLRSRPRLLPPQLTLHLLLPPVRLLPPVAAHYPKKGAQLESSNLVAILPK